MKLKKKEEERLEKIKKEQFDAINLDAGIASTLYQPTKLLERKIFLIDELEKSAYKFETEVLDNRSLKYMLERL